MQQNLPKRKGLLKICHRYKLDLNLRFCNSFNSQENSHEYTFFTDKANFLYKKKVILDTKITKCWLILRNTSKFYICIKRYTSLGNTEKFS